MLKTTGWIVGLVGCVAAIGCSQAEPDEQLGSAMPAIFGSAGSSTFCGVSVSTAPTIVAVSAAAETQLEQAAPTTSQGALETCTMKGGSNRRHCLLRFDLTSIPTSTGVLGGCLKVLVTDSSVANYPAAKMLRGWSEGVATWERAKLAVTWQVPGAWGPLDSGATTVATLPQNQSGVTFIPVATSLVQDWVTSPAGNYGIVFGNDSSYDGASIGTKEGGGIIPVLEVWTGP